MHRALEAFLLLCHIARIVVPAYITNPRTITLHFAGSPNLILCLEVMVSAC